MRKMLPEIEEQVRQTFCTMLGLDDPTCVPDSLMERYATIRLACDRLNTEIGVDVMALLAVLNTGDTQRASDVPGDDAEPEGNNGDVPKPGRPKLGRRRFPRDSESSE